MNSNSTIPSRFRVFLISLAASFLVLIVALAIQWLVYDDWQHQTGPLRIVGTAIASALTMIFMLRWQYSLHKQHLEMMRRFELISYMNDRIRNALQAIECVTYVSGPETTEPVRREVNAIDQVLREVLSETGVIPGEAHQKKPVKPPNDLLKTAHSSK
jgi:divalent metal cation (Fe/Co/Zn/Cd) transporter